MSFGNVNKLIEQSIVAEFVSKILDECVKNIQLRYFDCNFYFRYPTKTASLEKKL